MFPSGAQPPWALAAIAWRRSDKHASPSVHEVRFTKEILPMHFKRILMLSVPTLLLVLASFAQEPAAVQTAVQTVAPVNRSASPTDPSSSPGDYRLGAGDQIMIRATNAADVNEKLFRIDLGGFITAPTIGRVEAGGMTVAQLEIELKKRLGVYLQEPDVSVSVVEYQSQPVSIFGEVGSPGVHQLQGRKTLVELLSVAGGARPTAGPTLRITRKLEYGRIPLPGAKDDPTGRFSIAELDLKPLVAAATPNKDIAIQPFDIISIPKAELIYIAGDVTKSGPLTLTDRSTMSVLEALSATGGVTKTANTKTAHILRMVPGNAVREQVPVNISKIMAGKTNDVEMMAGDILVVPSSNTKKAAQRALEAAIQIGTIITTSGLVNGTL
jgi:polysaccharide export outer membrane protein